MVDKVHQDRIISRVVTIVVTINKLPKVNLEILESLVEMAKQVTGDIKVFQVKIILQKEKEAGLVVQVTLGKMD